MRWRRVSGCLGRCGDALRECREERVGEDDRQGLRGQHADRQGFALGQHPGHGVRRVAEPIGDRPDPDRRIGRKAVRAVERERDGRLRHAGFPGDVADARTDRALIHGPDRPPKTGLVDRFMTVRGHARPCQQRRSRRLRYDGRPMFDRVRAMPGGIRLFLVYARTDPGWHRPQPALRGRSGDLDPGQLRGAGGDGPPRLHDLHDHARPAAQAGGSRPRPGACQPDDPAGAAAGPEPAASSRRSSSPRSGSSCSAASFGRRSAPT